MKLQLTVGQIPRDDNVVSKFSKEPLKAFHELRKGELDLHRLNSGVIFSLAVGFHIHSLETKRNYIACSLNGIKYLKGSKGECKQRITRWAKEDVIHQLTSIAKPTALTLLPSLKEKLKIPNLK